MRLTGPISVDRCTEIKKCPLDGVTNYARVGGDGRVPESESWSVPESEAWSVPESEILSVTMLYTIFVVVVVVVAAAVVVCFGGGVDGAEGVPESEAKLVCDCMQEFWKGDCMQEF